MDYMVYTNIWYEFQVNGIIKKIYLLFSPLCAAHANRLFFSGFIVSNSLDPNYFKDRRVQNQGHKSGSNQTNV